MAFTDFASDQYIKTLDSNEIPRMGSFSTVNNGELLYIRSLIYINGVSNLGGSEQVRINIYADPGYESILFSSNYSSISDIPNIGTTNWIGYFRFTFNRNNINKNLTYYAKLETQNYTRNGDTFYIGFGYDYPFPIYDNGTNRFFQHPIAMQIFQYEAAS